MAGCSPTNKDLMMSYMERKYNEKFTFESIGTQSRDRSYMQMLLSSASLPPGEYIRVHLDKATREITDNYICYLMRGQMNDYLSNLAQPIYGANRVFSDVPEHAPRLLPEEPGPGADIETYAKAESGLAAYTFYVCKDEFTRNEDIEALRSAFEAKEFACSLLMIYLKDPSVLDQITDQDIRNKTWQNTNIYMTGIFTIMPDTYKFESPIEAKDWRRRGNI